jgi:hypothetical protein
MKSQMEDDVASRLTKRAVIGDRPGSNRAWEEEKPIRLSKMMRFKR